MRKMICSLMKSLVFSAWHISINFSLQILYLEPFASLYLYTPPLIILLSMLIKGEIIFWLVSLLRFIFGISRSVLLCKRHFKMRTFVVRFIWWWSVSLITCEMLLQLTWCEIQIQLLLLMTHHTLFCPQDIWKFSHFWLVYHLGL